MLALPCSALLGDRAWLLVPLLVLRVVRRWLTGLLPWLLQELRRGC